MLLHASKVLWAAVIPDEIDVYTEVSVSQVAVTGQAIRRRCSVIANSWAAPRTYLATI